MTELFRLPGPERFLSELQLQVTQGRSVVIRTPQRSPAVLGPLSAALEARGFPCRLLPPDAEPVHGLAWVLSIEDEIRGADPMRRLLSHERLRGGAVFLAQTDAHRWPAWQRLLQHLAEEVGDMLERPRIVLSWPADEQRVLKPSPHLAVHDWRGCVGELDARVHTGIALLERDLSAVQRRLLTELIVALCLWDLDLADRLLQLTPDALTDPVPALIDYAQQQGWNQTSPPSWALGTEATFEGSEQLHSAYCAISGRSAILRRRQWEAQASVVLPLIDRQRRDLVEQGFACFKKAFPFISHPEQLYDKDIGSLCHALNIHEAPADLRKWAEALRWHRNELAHLRPLPFGQIYAYRRW